MMYSKTFDHQPYAIVHQIIEIWPSTRVAAHLCVAGFLA